jgi:hypothetical protein
LLGVFKNVVVIAAGPGLGDNARSFLITLGSTEIQGSCCAWARATTFASLACFGDLFQLSTSVYFLTEIEAAPERARREIVEEREWRSQGGVREGALAIPGAEMAAPALTIHVSPMN